MSNRTSRPALEKPRFLDKVFRFLKDFYILSWPDTKFLPRKNILYSILSVTSFSINYSKTHKSQLRSEIKYDLYEISPNSKEPKNLILDFWGFKGFFFQNP